ncbi:MAG: aspartyl protease family protein [bacterium]
MGLTVVKVDVANVGQPKRHARLTFLVDSGAIYSVVPERVLKRLGVRKVGVQEFTLANGEIIRRRKGIAQFRLGERVGGADVIFGEPGDSQLLGATTLEAMGLSLDPLKRELTPLPMVLGGWQAPKRR